MPIFAALRHPFGRLTHLIGPATCGAQDCISENHDRQTEDQRPDHSVIGRRGASGVREIGLIRFRHCRRQRSWRSRGTHGYGFAGTELRLPHTFVPEDEIRTMLDRIVSESSAFITTRAKLDMFERSASGSGMHTSTASLNPYDETLCWTRRPPKSRTSCLRGCNAGRSCRLR